jgi:hypothetical protein
MLNLAVRTVPTGLQRAQCGGQNSVSTAVRFCAQPVHNMILKPACQLITHNVPAAPPPPRGGEYAEVKRDVNDAGNS